MPASLEILTPDRYRSMPWRNGGGLTREILVGPQGASLAEGFAWRVSLAEVREPGPFSVFPGCERSLTLLDGALTLAFGTREVSLQPRVPFPFAGDLACTGRLPRGPARDLNVITRRGFASHSVSIVPAGADAERLVGARLLLALALDAPSVVVADGERRSLAAGAALIARDARRLRVQSAGAVALIAIHSAATG